MLTFANAEPVTGATARARSLGVEDGLSQSQVMAIAQDSLGQIWLGTSDGLDRYDGYQFHAYKHHSDDPHSIPSSAVSSLYLDHEGRLWIGTYDAGLALYRPATDDFISFRHSHEHLDNVLHDLVWSMTEDSQGRLWIGTDDGMERFNPDTEKFTLYRAGKGDAAGLRSDRVFQVFQDREGVIWFCTNKGLSYVPKGGNAVQAYAAPKAYEKYLEQGIVFSATEDQQGQLWLAVEGGVVRLAPDRHVEEFYPGGTGGYIYTTSDNTVWVAPRSGGLRIYNPARDAFVNFDYSVPENYAVRQTRVWKMFEDRNGYLWGGTTNDGVHLISPAARSFSLFTPRPADSQGLSSPMVWAVASDASGRIWVGTDHGLNILDAATGKFEHYFHDPDKPQSLPHNLVYQFARAPDGTMWVATRAGIAHSTGKPGQFRIYHVKDPGNSDRSDLLDAIWVAPDGQIWAGGGGGLFILDPATGKTRRVVDGGKQKPDLRNTTVLDISGSADGHVWVADETGAVVLDSDGQILDRYTNDATQATHRLPGPSVNNIHISRDNTVWMGTDNGLVRLSPDRKNQRLYTEEDGLPSNVIYCVLDGDDGNLWISSLHGLSRLDPTTDAVTNFTTADGLQGEEFNAAACDRGPSGMLMFGGQRGFNVFDPHDVRPQFAAPPIGITGYSTLTRQHNFHRPLGPDSTITLDWRDRAVFIDYALFDFGAPGKNRFQYQLKGFSPEWHDSGFVHRATFMNLDPGKYVFRVRGENPRGIKSANTAELKLVVKAAPWATWWAYLGYVVGSLGLITLMVWLQMRRLQREHQLDSEYQRREWAETLHQLSQSLGRALQPAAVANELTQHLARLVKFDIAALFMEQGTTIELVGSRGLSDVQEHKLSQLTDQGTRLLAEFRHVRRPMRFDRSYLPANEFVTELPYLNQFMAAPLVSRGGELALLLVGRRDVPFTEQETEVAMAFSRQAVTALDNARLFAEVQNIGTTDALTRTYNRRFFFEQAELEFNRSQRYERSMALILMDADNFRDINEYYGHDVGDRVLKILAATCRDNLRHFDVVGRYSGESFVMLLPETSLSVAMEVAERLRKSVEDLRIETHRGTLRLTVSVGVAVNRNGEEVADLATLINKADLGLYEAKRAGRNRVVVSS